MYSIEKYTEIHVIKKALNYADNNRFCVEEHISGWGFIVS